MFMFEICIVALFSLSAAQPTPAADGQNQNQNVVSGVFISNEMLKDLQERAQSNSPSSDSASTLDQVISNFGQGLKVNQGYQSSSIPQENESQNQESISSQKRVILPQILSNQQVTQPLVFQKAPPSNTQTQQNLLINQEPSRNQAILINQLPNTSQNQQQQPIVLSQQPIVQLSRQSGSQPSIVLAQQSSASNQNPVVQLSQQTPNTNQQQQSVFNQQIMPLRQQPIVLLQQQSLPNQQLIPIQTQDSQIQQPIVIAQQPSEPTQLVNQQPSSQQQLLVKQALQPPTSVINQQPLFSQSQKNQPIFVLSNGQILSSSSGPSSVVSGNSGYGNQVTLIARSNQNQNQGAVYTLVPIDGQNIQATSVATSNVGTYLVPVQTVQQMPGNQILALNSAGS